MKIEGKKLNAIEARILTVLLKSDDYMNTTEIAKKASISWNTAFAHLQRFYDKGWVDKWGEPSISWKVIVEGES